jgi:hypothetical protein
VSACASYHRAVTSRLADSFWQNDRDLADACLVHPFVRGLADGSLPTARYRDYVAQDAFFLRAVRGAYALAGSWATSCCRVSPPRRWKGAPRSANELASGMVASAATVGGSRW